MDANRYFEQMHQVMSAQKRDFSLILSVKVQDLGGADAYIELRRNASGRARVFYSTMGRRNLNFQLFRKGWQLCHNASGEMTGRFPTKADALLDAADFSACIRDDAFDPARTEFLVNQLRRLSDTSCPPLPQSAREGALITGARRLLTACRSLRCSAGWVIFWPGASATPCKTARRPWSWPRSGRRSFARPSPARRTPSVLRPSARPRAAPPLLRRTPTGRAFWRCWPPYDNRAPPSGFPESGALVQYSIPCRAAMPFW